MSHQTQENQKERKDEMGAGRSKWLMYVGGKRSRRRRGAVAKLEAHQAEDKVESRPNEPDCTEPRD